jgi:phosphohistidine phosphatase
MMIVYLVRHAWAEEQDAAQWPDDGQRPLTAEGRERFAEVVKALADRGLAPRLIATSPLVRCRQTADIMAKHVSDRPKIVERKELEPGSDLEGVLRWTCSQAADLEQVAWVCHAPDVGRMAAAMLGDEGAGIRFAKGAVAALRFDGPPETAAGELIWLVTAKILGC